MTQSQSPETEEYYIDHYIEEHWVEVPIPNISNFVTEDDTPVDNLLSEKQQRLLTSSLYSSFSRELPFLAAANVALYYADKQPPIVPDILLSFDVTVTPEWKKKQNRSYFLWLMGKLPELAIEIVSNKVGNELGSKFEIYNRIGIAYYVVFDPLHYLGDSPLRIYERRATNYVEIGDRWMEAIGLGLTLWTGRFEGTEYTWLRWCDAEGNILLTGDERAETERQRAETEHLRAETERQRADRLAALLRERGIDPMQFNE